jgi:hypothetical protein
VSGVSQCNKREQEIEIKREQEIEIERYSVCVCVCERERERERESERDVSDLSQSEMLLFMPKEIFEIPLQWGTTKGSFTRSDLAVRF